MPDFKSSVTGNQRGLAKKMSRTAAQASAEDSLASAENVEDISSGADAYSTETSESAGFTSSVTGRNEATGKARGKVKKGPLGFLIALLFGGGALVVGSQSLMPFSLVAQIQDTFNSMQVSSSLRSDKFVSYQLDSDRVKNPLKTKLFSDDTFKISNSQSSKLAKQGIYYDDSTFKDDSGNSIRVMKFDDGTGELKVIAADESAASKLTAALQSGRYTTDSETGMKFNTTADTFKATYSSNSDFFNGYNKGSLTWRGSISGWFQTLTLKFLDSNSLTRNRFQDFRQKVQESEAGNTKSVAQELMSKTADELKVSGTDVEYKEDGDGDLVKIIERDGEGNIIKSYFAEAGDERIKGLETDGLRYSSSASSSTGSVKVKSEAEAKAMVAEIGAKYQGLADAGDTIQSAVNYTCLAANFLGSVTLLVTAAETLQIVTITTSYLEAIQKVQAGDGDDSPINELASTLTTTTSGTYTTLDDTNANATTVTTSAKSAMESSGISSLYSGNKVNASDTSVQSFNISNFTNRILWGLGVSTASYATCAVAKAAANAYSAGVTIAETVSCIAGVIGSVATFGATATACGPLLGNVIERVVSAVALSALIAAAIATATPLVTSWLTRDLISDLAGEDLGNAIASGSNTYLGSTHRANGGSLADRESYIAYAVEQKQVLADKARYERSEKSPFDASSSNTFLGTLLTKFATVLSSTSISSTLTSVASTVRDSAISLLPTATAYEVSSSLYSDEEYAEICPYLSDIGAIGDAYCNPYIITDVSTMDVDPADVIDKLSDNFKDTDSDAENVQIKGNSDLAKYILYCSNRTSSFGIADQNITNDIMNFADVHTESSAINTVSNAAIGAVPIIGDLIDVVQNSEALANYGYVTGEACVTNNDTTFSVSPNWSTAQYYQRFIEDQTLAESMGLIEKSAVTAFLDEYYEENPLDNSYEGILARYSGLTKDTVVAILDVAEYYDYIASIDHDGVMSFTESPLEEAPSAISIDSSNTNLSENIISVHAIVYDELRYRNFAA